jgi:hypothetical protein
MLTCVRGLGILIRIGIIGSRWLDTILVEHTRDVNINQSSNLENYFITYRLTSPNVIIDEK